jgi:hypothetical protein
MLSLKTTPFCKTTRCPSSYRLLKYHSSDRTIEEWAEINNHIRLCDFCGAEIQLLSHYSDQDDEYFLVEMPAQLRRLAEDLLRESPLAIPEITTLFESYPASH